MFRVKCKNKFDVHDRRIYFIKYITMNYYVRRALWNRLPRQVFRLKRYVKMLLLLNEHAPLEKQLSGNQKYKYFNKSSWFSL